MRSVVSVAQATSKRQPSIGSGWQKGINSCVRLTAIVPAMIAVSTTAPLAVAMPALRNAVATATGKRTRHSATASRAVAALAETSTMAGRPAASRWVSPDFFMSAADVEHFDLPARRRGGGAFFAVTIATGLPEPGQVRGQRLLARGDLGPQRLPARGEQAGEQLA